MLEILIEYDMERIVVIPHKSINDKSLSRFNLKPINKGLLTVMFMIIRGTMMVQDCLNVLQ